MPDTPIFSDDFESGDFSAWSATGTDGGDLSVSAGAAFEGVYGAKYVIDDTNTIYMRKQFSSYSEGTVDFWINVRSMTLANNGDRFNLCLTQVPPTSSTTIYQVRVWKSGGESYFEVAVTGVGIVATKKISDIPTDANGWIRMTFRHKKETSGGAGDGILEWLLNGVREVYRDNLAIVNDFYAIYMAAQLVDAGTSGEFWIDNVAVYDKLDADLPPAPGDEAKTAFMVFYDD